jgi:hypothetical protein
MGAIGIGSGAALAGVVVLAVVAATLIPFWRRGSHGLTRGELRVFSAFGEALLAGDDGARRPPMRAVLDELGLTLRSTSLTARWVVRLGAWAFDWTPILLLVSPRRFSAAALDCRVVVLRRAEHTHSHALGALFQVVSFPISNVVSGSAEGHALARVDRAAHIAACRAAREAETRRTAGGHR